MKSELLSRKCYSVGDLTKIGGTDNVPAVSPTGIALSAGSAGARARETDSDQHLNIKRSRSDHSLAEDYIHPAPSLTDLSVLSEDRRSPESPTQDVAAEKSPADYAVAVSDQPFTPRTLSSLDHTDNDSEHASGPRNQIGAVQRIAADPVDDAGVPAVHSTASEHDSTDCSEDDYSTPRYGGSFSRNSSYAKLSLANTTSVFPQGPALASPRTSVVGSSSHSEAGEDETANSMETSSVRKRSSLHINSGQAAVELFLRLNHARQSLDFSRRQVAMFAELDHAQLTIWEALHMLNELREYETALMGGEDETVTLSHLDHAFQTAELARLKFPDQDWIHLVGLIHGLGKLLAHARFGSQPQWAVCGETFPVGCRFANQITGSQFFIANPDRRRRLYNTPLGIYKANCGLGSVYMSWSACEYLYIVLLLNGSKLPKEALALIRYYKFAALTRPGGAYHNLLSAEDEAMIPLLKAFQKLCTFQPRKPPSDGLQGHSLYDYYTKLIQKYLGLGKLSW